MATRVRIISGPADRSYDHFINDIIASGNWEVDHEYFGIRDEERAKQIRSKIKTAGRHMKPPVAVKSFYSKCEGCDNGGEDCQYHVTYAIYDMDKARAYKAKQAEYASNGKG